MPFPGLFGVTLCRPVTTACPCVNMAAHKNRHILRAPVPSDAPVSVMSYTAGLLRPMPLSEYRIREQYLVIGHSANLYRHPRHHELHALPLHLRLPHESLHDNPRREPCASFILPDNEPLAVIGPADVPVIRLVVVGEVHPSATEDSQFD
ncbi:hypothetical protein DW193_12270 [Phocaeicola vulgatus]|uniref:Uncharacterized protein n=3 Tax=Bacteroidaceae TaxID=815 RepID=Q8A8N5_BACTN|nr:hypothetical protein BT_1132 [Bacteroides thetaiotaomicron VPI-5482]KAB4181737.1 hypothetical protein GAQ44_15225 [Bacteroides uniformis]MBT9881790.1 hypothetical protein [Bacteroides eggerthii]MBT9887442.1 hypothetical protein [Bacteroides thetaiotaomicron]MBT9911689.1 hypothetical protein [Phocaeicola dorei]RGX27740.1 hypothetical protein DWV27_21460 [Phocaeicola vulgatus]RJV36866.1 hypothetical protein DWY42_21260 [Bacteroides sp. AF25-18]